MSELHPLANIFELCSNSSAGRASQQQLDELGLLLDRLEEVEIYLDTNLSRKERADAEAELWSLTDRVDAYMELV